MKPSTFPEAFTDIINDFTLAANLDLHKPAKLAKEVLSLSDNYLNKKILQPWDNSKSRAAYMSYFFPLNYLRILRAIEHSEEVGFFQGINKVIDFGTGCGTALWAMLDCFGEDRFESILAYDNSHEALAMASEFQQAKYPHSKVQFHTKLSALSSAEDTLVISSYAINELSVWPDLLLNAKNLLIIEPATQNESRQLMTSRQTLIDSGMNIWAPCTHQEACPLLVHSKKDWCHDRVHVKLPDWFYKLEEHLPLVNRSLTYSYMAASNRPAPSQQHNWLRVIGDTLHERGKIRQAVCRGAEREFYSWLTRHGEPKPLPHGQLVKSPLDVEEKGNELRVSPPFK